MPLKPGATYIYERNGDEIYARESGTTERRLIGYSEQPDSRTSDGRPLIDHIREDKMWGEIRRLAKSNPGLQQALDRVILVYNIVKDTHE